ncbi:hypothetical protein [Agarilytica rhodophyticola]|uniref:hypothetical protein n=1 Tax=Agarilytica rhodophyticola TaxID=1737490 RepID=UPI000B343E7A|nr:hypothetical protein [Agarilytica rhodophyticola]
MDIYKKIQKARGSCITGVKEAIVESVGCAAELFDLSNESGIYNKIKRPEAVEVLRAVLHRDMAYNVKIMSSEEAKNLANDFVGEFGDDAVFYTNGEYGKPRDNPNIGPSWSPATDATFDTGIIVVSHGVVACAWFTDED